MERAIEKLALAPSVTINDPLPRQTRTIDRLSQIGDMQLKVMTRSDLDDYVEIILDLMEGRYADDEIKDETKTSFAAWRLRKWQKEILSRELQQEYSLKIESVREILKRAFHRYYYKQNIIRAYLTFLLEDPPATIDEDLMGIFQEYKLDNNGLNAYLRANLMNLLASIWRYVPNASRGKVRKIVKRGLTLWYPSKDSELTWYEKTTMYWLSAVLNIEQKQLGYIVNSKHDDTVGQYAVIYQLVMKKYSEPITSEQLEGAIYILKELRGYKNEASLSGAREKESQELNEWYSWIWEQLLRGDITDISDQTLLKLVRGGYTEADPRVWSEVFRRANNIEDAEGHFVSLKAEYYHLLNWLVDKIVLLEAKQLCSEEQEGLKWIVSFYNGLNTYPESKETLLGYVFERFGYLELIKAWDSGQAQKQGVHISKAQNSTVPLQEWLLKLLVEEIRCANPKRSYAMLKDIEIVELMLAVIDEMGKDEKNVRIHSSSVWIESFRWRQWRERDNCDFSSLEVVLEERSQVPVSEHLLHYGNNGVVNQQTYELSLLLLSLLKKQTYSSTTGIHAQARGSNSSNKLLRMSGYPSTVFLEIVAGSLNYQYSLYKGLAEAFSIELPNLPWETYPPQDLSKMKSLLKDYQKFLRSQDNNIRGLPVFRWIDVDMSVRKEVD